MISTLKKLFLSICFIAVIILISCREGENNTNFIFDFEDVLDSIQEVRLNKLYQDHETKTTNQIVLLTTPDFEPDSTIEDYSFKKFNNLGIGQKDKNNGVLIVFSSSMRQVRISTGYGTEKVLTDRIAKTIIDSVMIPRFKKQEYFEGIWSGSTAITGFLERPENKINPAAHRLNKAK